MAMRKITKINHDRTTTTTTTTTTIMSMTTMMIMAPLYLWFAVDLDAEESILQGVNGNNDVTKLCGDDATPIITGVF
jgi:hypothetical protein